MSFDAVRFAHKVAAIEPAYVSGTAQGLVWMDADFGYLRRSTANAPS
jgi:hypothetical protein